MSDETQAEIQVANIQAAAQVDSAQLFAQANQYGADDQVQATKYNSDKQLEGQKYSADRNHDSSIFASQQQFLGVQYGALSDSQARQLVAQTNATSALAVANRNFDGVRYSADSQRSSADHATDVQGDTQKYVSDNSKTASEYSADKDFSARVAVAQQDFAARISTASTDKEAREYSADQQFQGQKYSADQQLAGVQAAQAGDDRRLAAKIALANQRFALLFPMVEDAIDSGLGATQSGFVGGGTPPFISTKGVFTPLQVQQQINSAYARNDARSATQLRLAQGDLAGRGFSSNSPLIDALRVGLTGQNLRANNDAATAINFQAAQANREAQARGQEALNTQYNQQQVALLDAEKNQVTRQVGLISGLAQMVGSIN